MTSPFLLNTANGLHVALPDRIYLSRGQIVLTDDGKPRRLTILSMLDPEDMASFSSRCHCGDREPMGAGVQEQARAPTCCSR
jgi:hypothetical protein